MDSPENSFVVSDVPPSFGNFENLRFFRPGAYGTVWQAQDKKLGPWRALKILDREELSGSEIDGVRLALNALMLSGCQEMASRSVLVHGIHTATAEDVKKLYLGSGDPKLLNRRVGLSGECDFLVMDWLDGEPADVYLSRQPNPKDSTVHMLRQIASSLHWFHECGVNHRDVRPANILMDESGKATLIDFGLVTPRRDEMTDLPANLSLKYRSLEEWGGKYSGLDSDLYALGLVAYEALGGRLPEHGSDAEEWHFDVTLVQDDPWLMDFLAYSLHRDPGTRREALKMLESSTHRPRNAALPRTSLSHSILYLILAAVLLMVFGFVFVNRFRADPMIDHSPVPFNHRK